VTMRQDGRGQPDSSGGLRVVGAGLPRTGTQSLQTALVRLLGQPCYHMSVIPGHPFDLGEPWRSAFAGEQVAWGSVLKGYGAAVDWPASSFWRELCAAHP
jgi:Sulfotransferase domain